MDFSDAYSLPIFSSSFSRNTNAEFNAKFKCVTPQVVEYNYYFVLQH